MVRGRQSQPTPHATIALEAVMSEVRRGYKQTEVGVIPEAWKIVSTSQVCDMIVDCKNRTPPIFETGDYAVVRTPNVRSGKFVREDLFFTDEKSFKEWTARAVPQPGDVLITREAPLGEVCLVPGDLPVCLGQRMMLYRPNAAAVDGRFLLFALMSTGVQACLLKKIGGSTVGHAKVDDIRNLQIPFPPNRIEQEAIAEALSDADALIESLEQLLTKKRQIKQGAMQELLTGKKRLAGFKDVWGTRTLEQISAFITKGSTPTTYGFGWTDSGVMFLRSECVSERGLDLGESMFISSGAHTLLRRSEVRAGDILMTITGNVGRVIMLGPEFPEANINQHIARIRISARDVDPWFVFHMLTPPSVRNRYNSITTGQAYPQISLAQVRSTEISVPSLSEQTAIAAVLTDMDAAIATAETKLIKARQLKQGMMQELLTGRTRLV